MSAGLAPGLSVHHAPTAQVPALTLYALLKLRVDVFVVEQECAYPDLDGRDAEPGAVQLWAETAGGGVAATARLLAEPDGRARIGRVATARAARGAGAAGALLRKGIELAGDADVLLDAQSHLAGWYGRFGFRVVGEEYLDDGIPHLPMLRTA
ncbi:GNAT family N-acetyltransferase [Kineococcus terrestris]|uniref:GNAT family N-acetyltransferase n=1 Tax=Kineococcus terrestris TaxID=2044856 RepID=UPI0034DAED0D